MIKFDKICLRYAHRVLYDELSCLIREQDRIALVGPNGVGKTTFFRLLVGDEEPDTGVIEKAKEVRVGYLPQEHLVVKGRSLYEEAESVFVDLLEARNALEVLEEKLGDLDEKSSAFRETLEEMGMLQMRLEDLGIATLRSRVEKVLLGLGFKLSDMSRDTGEFSGGWQMRIALARLLLMEPSLLLLDEPTNHLDIVAQRWLESELKRYRGAVIIISHDQAFVDELCNRTFALSRSGLEIYEGNYSYYLDESIRRKEVQQKAFESQQKKIKKTEQFIERFRYKASKASQVQSRIKALDKLDRLDAGDASEQSAYFKFPASERSGQVVVELSDVAKSYGELDLFRALNMRIDRGEKLAIVGANGCGKSTLARIMAGEESVSGGELKIGHNVSVGYFAQQQADALDKNKDVLSNLEAVADTGEHLHLRSLLGSFLFQGDDVYKPVSVLSGGEKSRLALARILCVPCNCLILDEPTNHIDMKTKAILQQALLEYDGTCVIVSHDRAFLDPIVSRVIELSHEGVRHFPCNVSEYLEILDDENARARGSSNSQREASQSSGLSAKERRKKRAELREQLAPHTKELRKLESGIAQMETRKAELEAMLCDEQYFKNGDDAQELVREHRTIEENLAAAFTRWEELGEWVAATQAEVEQI